MGGSSGLGNGGEVLFLVRAPSGAASTTLDRMPDLADCGGAWCAGTTAGYKSMERINADISGALAGNWGTSDGYIKTGKDADGGAINGTPKSRNSVTYHIAEGATLSSDKILTATGSPYFAPSVLTVATGTALAIERGSVIKFAPGAGLNVNGILTAAGAAGNEVIFTSFYDDDAGGDLNNDDASTTPAAGDWAGVVFNNKTATSTFFYAKFYYASTALTYNESPVSLTDSIFENNDLGVTAEDNLPDYNIDTVRDLIFTNTATSSPPHFFCGFLDSMPWGEGDCELFFL